MQSITLRALVCRADLRMVMTVAATDDDRRRVLCAWSRLRWCVLCAHARRGRVIACWPVVAALCACVLWPPVVGSRACVCLSLRLWRARIGVIERAE